MLLDLSVIGLYLAFMFGIGFYFSARVKTTTDFYLSGRTLPTFVVAMTFAATFLGAASTMAKSGLAYKVGLPAVALSFASITGLYVFSIIAPKIRRVGATHKISSIPDLIGRRFGKGPALLAAVIVLWTLVGTIGSQMVATTRVLEVICAPWGMSYELAGLISLVVVVTYTMISGMYGVAYTDVVQAGILLILLGIALPIVGITGAGGFSNMQTVLPASFWSLKPDITIFGMMWVYTLYFLTGPPYWQRAFAAKSEKAARTGVFAGTTIILYYTFAITLVGMAAYILYPSLPAGANVDNIILMMCRDFYHPVFGALVMAAILAVLMSTIDSYLINAAQTFISDIVLVLKPGIPDEKLITYSKWAVAFLGFCAILFTLNIRNILNLIIFAMTFFSSALAIPTLASLYWRKLTKEGVYAGMITGIVVATVWKMVLLKPAGIHEAIPGGTLCLIAVVAVSLLTYKEENAAPYFE